ncbi:MAG: PD-(D/E)XK nuclease family protein [Candidatus Sericytochromatia bacterium]|nr:PD-(D/E)XK nuclease family protein [Candidatus Tanganyikabacteria bacterium]
MNQQAPLRLSPSAVRAYRECPFKFAMDYVRRLPDDQREPTPALAVGNAVHKAIATFAKAGGKTRVTKEQLSSLLFRNWDHGQFPDPDEERRHFARAQRMVDGFWDRPYPEAGAWDVAIERSVTWAAPRCGILATGRLDRVCMRPANTMEVIDYKTSVRPAADGDLATDVQALFYRSLAAEAFRSLGAQEIRIAFYYLDSCATAQIVFEREAFQAAWREIQDVAAQIIAAKAKVADGSPGDLEAAFPKRPGLRCQGCPIRRKCGADRS